MPPHRFQKGQSGNPAGRPKGSFNPHDIWVAISREPVSLKVKKEKYRAIVELLYRKAFRGNLDAIKIIVERTEGRPPQHISVTPLPNYDLAQLSDGELDKLEELTARVSISNEENSSTVPPDTSGAM